MLAPFLRRFNDCPFGCMQTVPVGNFFIASRIFLRCCCIIKVSHYENRKTDSKRGGDAGTRSWLVSACSDHQLKGVVFK